MSLFRYDPPAGSQLLNGSVRTFRAGGPIVCRTCGCRLEGPAPSFPNAGDTAAWRHFSAGHAGRDARGCTVGCVELDHAPDGSVIV